MYNPGGSFPPLLYMIEIVILLYKEKNKNMKNETFYKK